MGLWVFDGGPSSSVRSLIKISATSATRWGASGLVKRQRRSTLDTLPPHLPTRTCRETPSHTLPCDVRSSVRRRFKVDSGRILTMMTKTGDVRSRHRQPQRPCWLHAPPLHNCPQCTQLRAVPKSLDRLMKLPICTRRIATGGRQSRSYHFGLSSVLSVFLYGPSRR